MTKSWRALGPAILMCLLAGMIASQPVWASGEAADGGTPTTAAAEQAPPATAEAPAERFVLTPEFEIQYTINTLFMLISAVLVLLMQAGFAMVEVGLNSQKNAVNILFKNLIDLAVGVLLYLMLGYGLMYPGGSEEEKAAAPWFKFGGSFVTRDAQDYDEATHSFPSETQPGESYSNCADFMFQVAFAATAATIVSGAVAGRMKFTAYLIYTVIISGLVYPISGYWKWGGGALDQMGFQDFAGSIVVHAVGGFAALAGAIVLGARNGRFSKDGRSIPIPGHNLTFAALGVFILWIGWYGFNPGSQLTYNGVLNAEATTYIALTTSLAAAAGTITGMLSSWVKFGKPDLTMALNGALAGLVGITANCDRVSQEEAIVIGAIAGVLVFLGVLLLEKLRIDDPVGAFPVHGLCGLWGGLATGIFGDIPTEGMTQFEFFIVQTKASLIVCVWAFVTMLAVFLMLRAVGMLRVSPEEEQRGLDLSEHGMEAYVLT